MYTTFLRFQALSLSQVRKLPGVSNRGKLGTSFRRDIFNCPGRVKLLSKLVKFVGQQNIYCLSKYI